MIPEPPRQPVPLAAEPAHGMFDPAREKRARLLRVLRPVGLALAALGIVGVGAALGLARYGGAYSAHPFVTRLALQEASSVKGDPAERAARLAARLSGIGAREIYIVVDTFHNRLRIYRGKELLREAICSTGSGIRLRDPRDGKEWIFDTPQGELRILRKQKNPIWIKPDWAFIEEGYLPPKNGRDRVDDFSLGDYGLYMRDGYIIHGTIFKTLLGKRVTHGCIRLGDEDLKYLYEHTPVGARVFLY